MRQVIQGKIEHFQSFFENLNPHSKIKDIVSYLKSYLKDGFGESIFCVTENEYNDYDTNAELEKLGSPRIRVKRVHFFKAESSEALLGKFLKDTNFDQEYLGYLIVRNHENIPTLGRVVLKPYEKRLIVDGKRHIVHFLGREITFKAVPWKEQHGEITKCSGVAIWSALESISEVCHMSPHNVIQVQEEIGEKSDIASIVKYIHSRDQLWNPGAEGHEMSLSVPDPDLNRQVFRDLANIVLTAGVPILACVQSRTDSSNVGHLILITGIAPEDTSSGPYISTQTNGFKLYAHDDNYGPHLSFRYHGVSENSKPIIKRRKDDKKEFHVDRLIVPFHKSIRLTPKEFRIEILFIKDALEKRLEIKNILDIQMGYNTQNDFLKSYVEESLLFQLANELHSHSKYIGFAHFYLIGEPRTKLMTIICDTSVKGSAKWVIAITYRESIKNFLAETVTDIINIDGNPN
jgi:hypothetical protein